MLYPSPTEFAAQFFLASPRPRADRLPRSPQDEHKSLLETVVSTRGSMGHDNVNVVCYDHNLSHRNSQFLFDVPDRLRVRPALTFTILFCSICSEFLCYITPAAESQSQLTKTDCNAARFGVGVRLIKTCPIPSLGTHQRYHVHSRMNEFAHDFLFREDISRH
jgi:hypothetical protein